YLMHLQNNSFFLPQSYLAHLDLHSFPTRRSSDLLSGSARKGYIEYWKGIPAGVCHISVQDGEAGIYGLGVLKEYRGIGLGKQFRSEEHTSEFQSCFDFVCSLLF